MQIYKAERDAGLADQLRKPVVIACKVERVDPATLPAGSNTLRAGTIEKSGRALGSVTDEDLFWFKSLLVSSGFNDNDHYFTVPELWTARHTPEDKPINIDHVQHDIVGHMVAAYVVGSDKISIVADDTPTDELPDQIHIVDPGVLYARWEDDKLQERMDNTIAEISKGERSVSMEVWFKSFEYVVQKADGSVEFIPRNKTTAHLTKSLRLFGGSGKVDGNRLGMVLKGLTFAGKGLVKDPANPHSEILETAESKDSKIISTKPEAIVAAGYEPETKKEEPKMADANITPKDETDWKAKASELTTLVAALQTQVAEATAKLGEKDKTIEAVQAELATLKTASQKAARLDAIHTELKIQKDEAGKAKAEAFLAPLATLSDENFVAVLKNQASLIPAAPAKAEPVAQPLAELVPAKADASQLDSIKPDASLDLAVPAPTAKDQEVILAVANMVRNRNKNTKGK